MFWCWSIVAGASPAVDTSALPEREDPATWVRPPVPHWEVALLGGTIVNDPFLRPLLLGGTLTARPNPVSMGVVRTLDDLEALDKVDDPDAIATANQLHPSLHAGVIGRVLFGRNVGWYVDLRNLAFIEVVESDTLEMKNNLALSTGISFGVGTKPDP
jgi:hypothetical protein